MLIMQYIYKQNKINYAQKKKKRNTERGGRLSPSATPVFSILVLLSQFPRFSLRASHLLCSQSMVLSHYLFHRAALNVLSRDPR